MAGIAISIFVPPGKGWLLPIAISLAALTFLLPIRPIYVATTIIALSMMSIIVLSPDPSDILITMLLAVGLLTGHMRLKQLSPQWPVNLALGVFMVSVFVSALAGAFTFGSIDWIYLGNLLAKVAFMYFIVLYVATPGRLKHVFFGYLISGLVAAGLLYAGILGFIDWQGILPAPGEVRFSALAGDPNILGSYLVLLIIWLLDELLAPKLWAGSRIIKAALLMIILLAAVLPLSRGAWLNLGIALAVYLLIGVGRRNLRRVAYMAGVLVLAGFLGAWLIGRMGYTEWLLERLDPGPSTFYRFQVQALAIGLVPSNIFGLGPGQSALVLGIPPHNLFVQVLAENGWMAFAALVFIVGSVTVSLIRRIPAGEDGPSSLSNAVILAAWIGLLANSLVIDMLYWRILWFLLGLALAQHLTRFNRTHRTYQHAQVSQ